ncbi:hypothetical protein MesoLjLa_60270 [Mesorhizobium sp. L-2-11]|nr:hypothetical protein MesoLjLa_60270 [Mesorhizobium sp. L-2-11]
MAIGPNIDEKAVAKVKEHITDACAVGAQVVPGGEQHGRGGLFFTPPVPTAVTQEMKVAREDNSGWSRLPSDLIRKKRHQTRKRYQVRSRILHLLPRCIQVLAIHRYVRVANLHVSELLWRHAADLLREDSHDVAGKPSGFTMVAACIRYLTGRRKCDDIGT